jgi:hypothetical protein
MLYLQMLCLSFCWSHAMLCSLLALHAKDGYLFEKEGRLLCCPSASVVGSLIMKLDIACNLLALRNTTCAGSVIRCLQQCHGDRITYVTTLNADHFEWDNTSYRPRQTHRIVIIPAPPSSHALDPTGPHPSRPRPSLQHAPAHVTSWILKVSSSPRFKATALCCCHAVRARGKCGRVPEGCDFDFDVLCSARCGPLAWV